MIKKGHLKPDRIVALKAGVLSAEEMIVALEHIGECERCADAFAESYCDKELLNLSPDFETEVFSVIEKETIGFIRKKKAVVGKGNFTPIALKSALQPVSL